MASNSVMLWMVFVFFVLSLSTFVFSQKKVDEDKIYNKLDDLMAMSDFRFDSIPVPPDGPALEVKVSVNVLDIRNMDETTNTFTVDMVIYLEWYVIA